MVVLKNILNMVKAKTEDCLYLLIIWFAKILFYSIALWLFFWFLSHFGHFDFIYEQTKFWHYVLFSTFYDIVRKIINKRKNKTTLEKYKDVNVANNTTS